MSELSSNANTTWVPYLDPDERVLWQGRPSQRLFLLSQADYFLIPFSLLWAGFAIPGSIAALWSTENLIAVPFFLIFFGAGVYITIGRFLVNQYQRRHTYYALTSKRAFILNSAFSRRVDIQPVTSSLAVSYTPGPEGSITLGEVSSIARRMTGLGIWTGNDGSFTFRSIRESDKVYNLIRHVQRGET